eukprot:scaffold26871_cov72-Phaeocystis_antarctica.AAC.2
MTISFSSRTRSRKGLEGPAVTRSRLDKNEPTNAIFHKSAATTHHTIASHGTSHNRSQQYMSSVPLRVGTPFRYVSDGVVVTQSITGSIATNGETITAFTSIAPRTGSTAALAAESFTSPSMLVSLPVRFSNRSGLPHQIPFCNGSASEATARLPKTALGPTELPGCNTAPLATKEPDLRAMLRKRGRPGRLAFRAIGMPKARSSTLIRSAMADLERAAPNRCSGVISVACGFYEYAASEDQKGGEQQGLDGDCSEDNHHYHIQDGVTPGALVVTALNCVYIPPREVPWPRSAIRRKRGGGEQQRRELR